MSQKLFSEFIRYFIINYGIFAILHLFTVAGYSEVALIVQPIFSKHVLTEDTVYREVKNGKLISKRLLSKTNPIPKWAERFVSGRHVHIIEESIVDPTNKVLITYTRNLGYTKVMVIIMLFFK